MKARRAVKFISKYSPTLTPPAVCAKNVPAGKIKTYLCLSVLLGVLDVRRQKQQVAIAWKSLIACRRNGIYTSDFSNLPEPPRSSGGSWVLGALEWTIDNSSSLRSQGIGLIVDSLLSATKRDVPRIIHRLKEIRTLNVGLYSFDQTEQLINMDKTNDIISSDDYIDIWVHSEVALTESVSISMR